MPLTRVRTGGVDSTFALSASMMPSGTILQTKTISSTTSVSTNTSDDLWLNTSAGWATTEQHGIVLTTKKANSIFNCFFSGHVYYENDSADGNICTQYSYIGHSTSSTSGYTYVNVTGEYYDARSGDTSLPNQRQNTPSGGVSFSLSHAAGTTVYFALKSIYTKVGNEIGQNFTVHEVSA